MLTRKTTFSRIGQWFGMGSLALLLIGGAASCDSGPGALPPNDMGGVGAISVTSVSPAVAGMTGGTPVAVYGSGFAAGATVAFGHRDRLAWVA